MNEAQEPWDAIRAQHERAAQYERAAAEHAVEIDRLATILDSLIDQHPSEMIEALDIIGYYYGSRGELIKRAL